MRGKGHTYLNSAKVVMVMVRPMRDRRTPTTERTCSDCWLLLMVTDVSPVLAPIS